MKEKSEEDAKKNVDPLTGAPGSHPVAAWAKVSHDIGPRDPDREIRSGL